MKTLYALTISLLIISHSKAQSYSKLIDLGIDNQNVIQDYNFDNNELLVLLGHICDNINECFSLSTIDYSNGKIDSTYFDEDYIFPGNNRSLLKDDNRIIISSQADDNNLNNIELTKLIGFGDSTITYKHFIDQDTIRYINDGILKHKGDYYVWGEGSNDVISEPNGHIIKLDSSLTLVKDAWYFNRGTFRSYLNDLQIQPDGNLTFLIKSDGPPSSNIERTDSLHLIKIDTSGNIIKEITIEEGMDIKEFFHTLRNGNYVIMNFRETVYGRIQCIDHETGEVIWDWELPKGMFNEFNRFSIRDYAETSNGDIVICGLVQEVLDDIWDKSRWTAIAARLSSEGELKWFRRFLVPNETNPEEKGPYHFDILKRVFERTDSTLCFLGESTQINLTPPHMQYAWILALDEDDCYKGNCSDTIVIDKRLSNKPKFELGAKWTYECELPNENKTSFLTYEFVDSFNIDTMTCHTVEPFNDTICISGNKVFKKFKQIEQFRLIYDFDAQDAYTSQCYDIYNDTVKDFTVTIDSIGTEQIADGQLLNVQYVRAEANFDFVVPGLDFKVYEGIGSAFWSPFLRSDNCIEMGEFEEKVMTDLRCFENSTASYRFVDYSCDSTWITTSTNDIIEKYFNIYPNPTDGIVYIEDGAFDMKFILSNTNGQVIKSGSYDSQGIYLPYKGIFLLTLITDRGQWTERVLRY